MIRLLKDTPKLEVHLRPDTLKLNVIWTFFGNFVYAGCQWLLLTLLARFWGAETVGAFASALALTGPVFMLAGLQLRAVQSTDAKHVYDFSDYAMLRVVSIVTSLILIIPIAIAAKSTTEEVLLVIFVGLAKSFELGSDLFYGLLQQRERMDLVAVSKIVRGILSVVTMWFGLQLSQSILGGVVGMAMSWLLSLILLDYRIVGCVLKNENYRPKGFFKDIGALLSSERDFSTLRQLFLLTLPLGLGVFLTSFTSNIPKYFVEYFHGVESLGYFAAVAYVATGMTMVSSALSQSTRPRLAKYFAFKRQQYYRLFKNLISVGVIVGGLGVLISMLFGRRVLTLIYGIEYADYLPALSWLMVFVMLSWLIAFFHAAIQAARIFNIQLHSALGVCVTTILIGFYFVRRWDVVGAAITMTTAAAIHLLILIVVFLRYIASKRMENA